MNTILYLHDRARFKDVVFKQLFHDFELIADDCTGDIVPLCIKHNVAVVIIDCVGVELMYEMCRVIRSYTKVYIPVLVVTQTNACAIVQQALEIGADNWINMTTLPLMLPIKLKALMRYRMLARRHEIRCGELCLDHNSLKLSYREKEVELKRREYQILWYLLENRGMVISRDRIMDKYWGELMVESNVVDVHVGRIRKKLKWLDAQVRIEAVYGGGYRLMAET